MTEVITPPEEDPRLDEIQAFWRKVGQEMVEKSVSVTDEAAKQVIAVAGILEGLYFHAITFSDLHGETLAGKEIVIYIAPILILLFSLITSLLVFFPDRIQINIASWQASKIAYEGTDRSKLLLLRAASISLMIGVFSIGVAVLTYLGG